MIKTTIIHECGCGNKVEEKINPEAASYELKAHVCNKCSGSRMHGFPMNRRVEVESVSNPTPQKKK